LLRNRHLVSDHLQNWDTPLLHLVYFTHRETVRGGDLIEARRHAIHVASCHGGSVTNEFQDGFKFFASLSSGCQHLSSGGGHSGHADRGALRRVHRALHDALNSLSRVPEAPEHRLSVLDSGKPLKAGHQRTANGCSNRTASNNSATLAPLLERVA